MLVPLELDLQLLQTVLLDLRTGLSGLPPWTIRLRVQDAPTVAHVTLVGLPGSVVVVFQGLTGTLALSALSPNDGDRVLELLDFGNPFIHGSTHTLLQAVHSS